MNALWQAFWKDLRWRAGTYRFQAAVVRTMIAVLFLGIFFWLAMIGRGDWPPAASAPVLSSPATAAAQPSVPSSSVAACRFVELPVRVLDRATGKPLAGAIVAVDLWDSVGLNAGLTSGPSLEFRALPDWGRPGFDATDSTATPPTDASGEAVVTMWIRGGSSRACSGPGLRERDPGVHFRVVALVGASVDSHAVVSLGGHGGVRSPDGYESGLLCTQDVVLPDPTPLPQGGLRGPLTTLTVDVGVYPRTPEGLVAGGSRACR